MSLFCGPVGFCVCVCLSSASTVEGALVLGAYLIGLIGAGGRPPAPIGVGGAFGFSSFQGFGYYNAFYFGVFVLVFSFSPLLALRMGRRPRGFG